jgi:hypothetical protein
MSQPSALVGAAHRQMMNGADIPEEDRGFSGLVFLPEESVNSALEGEESVMFTGKEELESRRYEGRLRPHAEGALSLL